MTFTAPVAGERYRWLETTLRQFRYDALKRPDKGLLQAFLRKVTGYSRAQLTRLIGGSGATGGGLLIGAGRRASRLLGAIPPPTSTPLVALDRLHQQLSGPATKKLAERAAMVFGDRTYERLATGAPVQPARQRRLPAPARPP